MTEANQRMRIDKLLLDSGWVIPGWENQDGRGEINVYAEVRSEGKPADYVLKDSADFPLCVVEAKKELINPLTGKEQARGYAESLNCRFIILSNGVSHYYWDIQHGSPTVIDIQPPMRFF